STDLITWRDALAQINQLLGQQEKAGDAARPTPTAPAEWLRDRFKLRNDEWAEISSDAFTLLDGHHLETALLLRDAEASFTRDGGLPAGQPLARAEAAFAWSVRQVRLQEGPDDTLPLPVGFVLR